LFTDEGQWVLERIGKGNSVGFKRILVVVRTDMRRDNGEEDGRDIVAAE